MINRSLKSTIMKRFSHIIPVISLIILIISFFLPYYEASRQDYVYNYTVVRNYEEIDIGIIVIYNGFALQFAIFNFCLAIVLVLGFYFFESKLYRPIIVLIFFIIAVLLVNFGCSAGFGRPIGDRMLIGYTLTEIAMILLIIQTFGKALMSKDDKILDSELIDD